METRPQNQNEQPKTTKNIFHSPFHSFSSTLVLWKMVDIKSNEKTERATTDNEKQQRAAKSYEEHQKIKTDSDRGWKNLNEQEKTQKSKWKQALLIVRQ